MTWFRASGSAKVFGSALAILSALTCQPGGASPAQGGGPSRPGGETRVYILRGLGGELTSSAVDDVGDLIRSHDPRVAVRIGNWREWEDIVPDAASRPGARIVLVGFSMGARAAGLAANALARRGVDVKVVGLDPMCADAAVDASPHIRAVSFYRSTCGAGGQMRGALNVRVGRPASLGIFALLGHAEFPSIPAVRQLVVHEVFRDDFGASRPRERR